jgi:hypothetical protein
MTTRRFIIRAKAGRGMLYVNVPMGIFTQKENATHFTIAELNHWGERRSPDDVIGYTFVDTITGEEFNFYDGPSSNLN